MGIGFFVIGLILLAFWYFLRRRASKTMRWPSVNGRIIDSRLVEGRDSDGDRTLTASVIYAYEVAGAQLQGNSIAVGGGSGNPKQIVARYPAGAEVQVFYDPAKPKSAVLEPGGSGLKGLLVVGLITVVVGVIFTVASS